MFNFFKKKDKEVEEKVKELNIYALCDGEFINIEKVDDEVFAQKMMGDGFAIIPSKGDIYSPVDGQVDNIFPTKHAISLKAQDVEVLIHMGIDTVSLEGRPFKITTGEHSKVTAADKLAEVDLNLLEKEQKDNAMIVVFTNGAEAIENIEFTASGTVKQGDIIGRITVK